VKYDKDVIENTLLEELSPADYYVECCAFLEDFVVQRPKLAGAEVLAALGSLMDLLRRDPSEREFDATVTLQQLVGPFLVDSHSSSETAASAVAALLLFGMAGKSLYFLSQQKHAHQFEKEMSRFFVDIPTVRSNIWLFHTSAQLAQAGFKIEFVAESEEPTPDFLATAGNLNLFVEANARTPRQRDIEGIKDALWNVMHGDAKSSGKQLKFRDPGFDPGLIVLDISNCDVNASDTGLPPHLKLLPGALVANNKLGRIYDISRDPDFFEQPENLGNVVEYAVRYFHTMAAQDRYHVRALLVGVSMGVRTVEKGILGAPKGSLMVVDSRYPQLALQQLSRQIYLVDTRSPLPDSRA
jgi:hypothetical protein